jgi:hypothetical protein
MLIGFVASSPRRKWMVRRARRDKTEPPHLDISRIAEKWRLPLARMKKNLPLLE